MKNLANFSSAHLTHHRSALDRFQLAAFVFVPPPPPKKKIHFLASIVNKTFSTGQKKIPQMVITILEHQMLFFVNVMHQLQFRAICTIKSSFFKKIDLSNLRFQALFSVTYN